MSDPYAIYVLGAYGATAAILGSLIWATLRTNTRIRTELEEAERRGKR
ncbi:MAG: heme exporter protein CcmD [Pseudomonadota bacterium]